MRRYLLFAVALLGATFSVSAQSPPAGLDLNTIARIRTEAIQHSQAVEDVWWLSEVHGPRATGTPAFAQASEWAMKRFTEIGRAHV